MHVCAYMWGSQSHHSPAGGSVICYITLESRTCTSISLSVFDAAYVLHYHLIQEGCTEKEEAESLICCIHVVSVTTDYRYSSSFTYRISCAELGTWLTPPTTRRRSLITMEEAEHRGKVMGANLSHFFL